MASATIKAISLAALLLSVALHAFSVTGEDARIARVFNDPISTITIENLAGATDLRIWSEPGVSVTATRPASPDNARIETEVLFERPTAIISESLRTRKAFSVPSLLPCWFRPVCMSR